MALQSLGGMANVFRLIREVDLAQLKTESEAPFSWLVVGEGELPYELAEALSMTPGQRGIHPFITVAYAGPRPSADLTRSDHDLALLCTADAALSDNDQQWLAALNRAGIPVLTVVVGVGALQRVGSDTARPGEVGRVALASLDEAQLTARLVPTLLAALPESRYLPLARHLPLFRPRVINDLVEETSRANAIYSASTSLGELIPGLNIPFVAADMLILTKNQFIMAYKIALAAGKSGEPKEIMGEVASVLGGGLIFRQVARELVGLIPVIGIIPKIAVAYAGTRVIGKTASAWAQEGVRLSGEDVRALYDEAAKRGRAVAERLRRQERTVLPAPDNGSKPSRWQRLRDKLPF